MALGKLAQFSLNWQNLTVRRVSWDQRFFSFRCVVTNQFGSLLWDYFLHVKGALPVAFIYLNAVCGLLELTNWSSL